MDRKAKKKGTALFLGTVAFAFSEWLMFEVLRTPYRPPEDMLTLLGREKNDLFAFMVALAIIWTIVSVWILTTTRLTLRQYFGFLSLVALLMSGILYIVRNPHRPVTPWELLWS